MCGLVDREIHEERKITFITKKIVRIFSSFTFPLITTLDEQNNSSDWLAGCHPDWLRLYSDVLGLGKSPKTISERQTDKERLITSNSFFVYAF